MSEFEREAVAQYKLDTIEKYYEYMSQANMCAPAFSKLTEPTQDKWRKRYDKARGKV